MKINLHASQLRERRREKEKKKKKKKSGTTCSERCRGELKAAALFFYSLVFCRVSVNVTFKVTRWLNGSCSRDVVYPAVSDLRKRRKIKPGWRVSEADAAGCWRNNNGRTVFFLLLRAECVHALKKTNNPYHIPTVC